MVDDPTSDEAKELYAYFGLAFYCSSVLEHGIANAILILELLDGLGGAKTRREWEMLVDKHFEESFSQTFGKLKNRLSRHNDRFQELKDVMSDIEKCVGERNFLAHHFWRENAMRWFTRTGREAMVQRLEQARELFSETDKKLEVVTRPLAERHGITEDVRHYELGLIKKQAE